MNEISPFFKPGAPPPTLPILVAQTEIGVVSTLSKLLAQEEIGSGPMLTCSSTHFTPYPKLALRKPIPSSQFSFQSAMPGSHLCPQSSAKSAVPALQVVSLDVESSEGSHSGSESESLSDTEADDERFIPKPAGEAGRPGHGGYNLKETRAWHPKEYKMIKVIPHSLSVKEHLDISKSFNKHSVTTICYICNVTTEKFSILESYANCWPVIDFVRLELKYTSRCAKEDSLKTLLPSADPKPTTHTHKSSCKK
ncbi:hypothetical protein CPB84DRAFT_1687214 [Gymnopilus junonius]|uniref:Uncharacterized protein n=1 Tax=Gymnopilus junonius TaxID=109634 RepID=A0A9P5NC79_GYMJU|nr:hypothetical protein CPB84DRAFT_1687214 [Gymnopilus junonius]